MMDNNLLSFSEVKQDIVLESLIRSSYYFNLASNEITIDYFTTPETRVIYKALRVYYSEYDSLPSKAGLLSKVEEAYLSYGLSDLEEVNRKLDLYFSKELESADFIIDTLGAFIRKARLSKTLIATLSKLSENPKADIDTKCLSKDLADAIDINFAKSSLFSLSDTESLKTYREDTCTDEIIKSVFPGVNYALQYGGYIKGNLNMVVAPTGGGKTSFLINEGANAASNQGKRVLNVFIGDMTQYDGWVRYVACITGYLQKDLIGMSDEEQASIVRDLNVKYDNVMERIDLLTYGPSEITVSGMIEDIRNAQEKNSVVYDVIIIDYADNLIMEEDTSMYEARGAVYDRLALFSRTNKSVIFVASQPKINEWSEEILSIKSASESSKKQHIVDVMITLGMVSRNANVGTCHLAKVRRGITGHLLRFKTEWQRCRIHEIEEKEYLCLRAHFE